MSKYNSKVGKDKIRAIINDGSSHVHFIGVGGVGMYSLFRLTERLGRRVSGSDRERSEFTLRLEGEKCDVHIGHSAENVKDANLVVYTLALSEDNPEILYAVKNSIPTVSRAEYLGALMEEYKERIGISGTHGKSTTTAMLDAIFTESGREPTSVAGAILQNEKQPFREGKRDFFIYEACEYMDSFLRFSPTASVFTNIELDHVDYFKDIEAIKASFLSAMDLSPLSVVNVDDANIRSLIPLTKSRCVSYGTHDNADYRVYISSLEKGRYSFKIRHEGIDDVNISLKIPGKFNVMNAAAATAVSLEFGIEPQRIEAALSNFSGIQRRLQKIGEYNGASVFYDYAHHPTEISGSINAVRECIGGRVAVIFKPHTYSRTAAFEEEIANALSFADEVLLCDISGIREENVWGVSSKALVSKIKCRAKYVSEERCAADFLSNGLSAVIIMGAANLDAVREGIIKERN